MSETPMSLTTHDADQSLKLIQAAQSYFPNKVIPSLGCFEDHIDAILVFQPKGEKEFVKNVRIIRNAEGDIDLGDLLRTLKRMSFPIERNVISYYSNANDMFIYCGNDPLPPNFSIPATELGSGARSKQVTIRIRQVLTDIPMNLEPILENDVKLEGSVNFGGEGANTIKQKRTKERKIGDILDKVLQWRRLYTGVIDPTTGQAIKLSLEEAAQRVGISKKSLDDYLLQIRFGKKHGFNFNEHYNERVGVLRTFVKKYKGVKDPKLEDLGEDLEEDDSRRNQELEHNIKIEATSTTVNKRTKKRV